MSNQGTIRLKVTNGAPAIEKLWNGRFKLEFLCDNNSPKEDWYYENISSILPDYGILQETNFGSGVSEDWEAIPDSVYPDMRLVETEYVYIPSMGDKRVKLTYETLTASWVEEKSEDTDYELNGLKRVSRTFVALPGTTYDKVVGTNTINSDGTTLYLGSFRIEKTEAKWELTEVWLEAGVLSLSQEFVGGATTIQVSAFGMTESQVDADLSEVTASHILISQSEGDYKGIKTSTFQYQIDESITEDYELNGLKSLSITELSSTNFTARDIGVAGAAATPQAGLYLGAQDIDNGGAIKVRESVWFESGQISISEESGPQGIPNTKIRRYTSQVTEPSSLGIALSRSKENTSGYTIYNYSFLEGAAQGSSPVTASNEVISYRKNIEVRAAGRVFGDTKSVTGGSLAYVNVVPPSIKNVQATVSIKLVTTNTVSAPVAYNLSGTSCSATLVTSRKTPIGVEQGSSLTVSVFNRSYSANARSFPNSYHTGGSTGTISTPAQILRDDDSIIGEALEEETVTSVSMSGSSTAPATTGVYQDEIDPAFLDADGTQYYRRTTYTI